MGRGLCAVYEKRGMDKKKSAWSGLGLTFIANLIGCPLPFRSPVPSSCPRPFPTSRPRPFPTSRPRPFPTSRPLYPPLPLPAPLHERLGEGLAEDRLDGAAGGRGEAGEPDDGGKLFPELLVDVVHQPDLDLRGRQHALDLHQPRPELSRHIPDGRRREQGAGAGSTGQSTGQGAGADGVRVNAHAPRWRRACGWAQRRRAWARATGR